MYASLKEKVRKELASVSFFSSTTDLWSSIGMKPYISFTVHFIDSQWVLQSRCLQTQVNRRLSDTMLYIQQQEYIVLLTTDM